MATIDSMKNQHQPPGDDPMSLSTAQALRRQAEDIARAKANPSPEHLAAMAPEKARRVLHELQVHQIELELQNEELQRAQVELSATRARYFDLYDLAPVGYCSLSEAGLILEANLTAATLLGTARSALVNQPITRYILNSAQDSFYLYHKRLVATGEAQACELQMHDLDGVPFWARLQASIVRDADGVSIWRIVLTDISERKQNEARLFLLGNIFSNAREGILITAADGTIIDVNESFSRISGYARDEVLGQTPQLLSSGYQQKVFYSAMWQDLQENGHWHGEIWNRRKNGERYAIQQTISAVCDAHSNTRQYVALFSDVTELKKQERALEHIAHYDALTTLPNRVQLAEQLKRTMAHALLHGQRLAVAYLDLDGFKAINDHHGHAAGDLLLIAVASRMKQALREGDSLARIGGDEFVAVLLDLPDGTASAPMLTRLLAAAGQPELIGDAGGTLVLQVTASLGVTFYPQTDEVDADQLLRQADQAMYQAKLAGKNRYQVFDAELDRSIRGHHESVEHIRHALGAREFLLYYQPKVNMRTGAVIGAEALIRWQHPVKGLLPPAVFLPVIEEHPLAIDLGEWVIDTALTQLEIWHAAGLDIPVSVNICARQLQQANFVERLRGLLAAHPQIKPGCLELEVLETSALEDLAQVSQVISACREIGVMFALDDFGTGYSSLTYLKRLSVAQLKIDQSFVRDMLDDPDDLSILEGVLGLATAFRRQVIAEGVETVEHGKMLLQLGCELAQGYGIARPMPADELPGWSATWRPDATWRDVTAVSRDDLPVLFARVEHIAWVAALENHLKDMRAAPPSLDHRQCRFGMWLYGELLAGRRSLPVLQAIVPLHEQVHALAVALLHLKSQGRTPEALAQLGELHALRDDLLALLETLKQR
jgi:diguanylate cyclase (GGDEF)-like protein/PAS domain S-box-containing protein